MRTKAKTIVDWNFLMRNSLKEYPLILSASICLVCIFCSCAPPQYNIKRVAMVPAPYAPSRSVAPLDSGALALQFEANPFFAIRPINDDSYYPSPVGAPGIRISNTQLGISAYTWITDILDLGAQFRWTSEDWTQASAYDVPMFPKNEISGVSVYGIGMKLKFPLDESKTAHFSAITEFNLTPIPEATFIWDTLYGQWNYLDTRIESWFFPAVFFQFDKKFSADVFDIHAFTGFQRSVTNVGFDWDTTDCPDKYTVEGTWVFCFGGGADYFYRNFFFGSGVMLSNSPQFRNDQLSASFFFRTGLVFGDKPRTLDNQNTTNE